MTNTYYYLREINYFYSDECSYPVYGVMTLKEEFDNLAEAESTRWQKEAKRFSGMHPEDRQPLSSINNDTPAQRERWEKLDEYVKKEFGNGSFLVKTSYAEELMPNRDYAFPNDITTDQAKELKQLTGVEFYAVIEVKDQQNPFFGLYLTGNYGGKPGWITTFAIKAGPGFYEEAHVPVVFYDRERLTVGSEWAGGLGDKLDTSKLQLPVDELTDTPALLRAFANANFGMGIDDQDRLKLDYPGPKLLELNELLKIKIFEFRPIPLHDVLVYREYFPAQ